MVGLLRYKALAGLVTRAADAGDTDRASRLAYAIAGPGMQGGEHRGHLRPRD
jgi:hypothetical protein